MTNLTLKRPFEDQDTIEAIHPKSKKYKLDHQQGLIRKVICLPKSWMSTPKNTIIKQEISQELTLRKEDTKSKAIIQKPKLKAAEIGMMKPKSCMKCNNQFYTCSFTLSETKDLQECCLQTVRCYLLQRSLGFLRNKTEIS